MLKMQRALAPMFLILIFRIGLMAQPVAGFNINYPALVCNPAVISFTNTSTGTPTLTYEWNFGVTVGTNSIQTNPSITYITCGTFNVTLIATDGNGLKDTVVHVVTVHCSPTVSFTVNQTSGCIPLACQFTNSSTAGSGTITSYAWDFGDGFTSTNANPNHTYTTSGCKTVTLTITNSFGCITTFTMNNAVCLFPKPVANFSAPVTSSCSAPFTATFNSSVSGGTGPYTYQWSFPNGNPATSTATNPSSTYNSPGSYNVQLIVTDANGCKDTLLQTAYILIGNNTTNFTISALSACAPATFNVSGTGTPLPSSFAWTTSPAGSPSTAATQNASFTFSSPGSYQICLNSTFSSGCVATKCTTVNVLPTPIANFTATGNLNACAPPQTIHFTNTTSGSPTTYSWTFTGGTPATFNGANPPNIVYSNCGNYNVSLTVTSANGCTTTASQNNFVNINCPVAAFTANPLGGCVPVTVNFNSTTSTGQPTIWNWNFGDPSSGAANTSNQQNPTHVYNSAGCHTVTLITNNAQGCGDTETQPNLICVGTPPVANFSSNPPVACASTVINFTNLSTNIFPYTSYVWDFEGVPPYDNQSTAPNPGYQYSDTGWFDVTLIACNYGCCDTLTIQNMEHILPPIAKIVTTRSCLTPFNVHFDGSQSIGANTYTWSFPGGTPASSSAINVNVVYPASGTYTATLTVFNNTTGCSYTTSTTLQIRNIQANFTATPLVGCAPLIVTLNNSSIDFSTLHFYVTNSTGQVVFSTTNAVQGFILPNPGVYSVELIATDVNGCSDTLFRNNYITVYGFHIAATAAPNTGCVPLLVQFTDNSTSVNSTAVSWSWNFGDPLSGAQNTSSLQNPSHTYVHSGAYNVTLSITDNHGCVSTGTISNMVNVIQPIADFAAIDSTICLGTQACFFNYSSGNNLTFQWSFGDGGNSTQANPCHNYLTNSIFNVRLIATDSQGCKDTLVKPVLVSKVVVGFTSNVTSAICPILPVQFTSTTTGAGNNASYFWDFGDGSTSTIQNPMHTYVVAGFFDVSLIVVNQYGCSDTLLIPQYIQIGGPIATVSVTPQSGCAPLTVCFYVTSTNSVSITWDFGDGVVMPGPDTICYTYLLNGVFHPQVILSNGVNCTYAMPLDSVVISAPTTLFSSTSPLCDSGLVQFTNLSTGLVPITNYQWNFGDPSSGANNTSTQINPSHNYSSLGNYLVTLVSTNVDGCTSQLTDTVFVVQSPTANFGFAQQNFCEDVVISFSDSSQSPSAINSWLWNFGDALSGASNISSLQNPSHIFSVAGTYVITEWITDQFGCTDSVIQNIIIHPHPTVSAGGNQTVCLGGSVQLNASGGISYLWTPAGSLSAVNISNPIASPATTCTYTVLVTDANGCTNSDSAIVTINGLPVIHAGNDTSTCLNAAINLNASGGATYNWSPSTGLSSVNIPNPVATPLQTTTYVVSGTDINGCFGSDTVVLTILSLPNVNAGPGFQICIGDSVQLNASGGVSYIWVPATGLNNPLFQNPVATPANTTTYTAIGIDNNGCSNSDTTVVLVHQLPLVVASSIDSVVCLSTSTMLNASGAVNYVWTPITFLNDPLIPNPVSTPVNNITYTVTGTDQFGCVNEDSVSLVVVFPFSMLSASDTDVCLGESVQLFSNGAAQYIWTPPAGLDNPTSPNPIATPSATTTYTVIGSDNICFHDTAFVVVVVNPLPVIDAGNSQQILAGETATLTAVGDSGWYQWSPSDLVDCVDCISTTTSPGKTTQYNIEVTNEFGCRATDSVTIFVICNNTVVFIPNAFTPNNDGKNDIFRIRSNGLESLKFFRVYDRWGALIFETSDLNEGWDGTFKNGLVRPDVFIYHIEAVCTTGDVVSLHGNVTVIR